MVLVVLVVLMLVLQVLMPLRSEAKEALGGRVAVHLVREEG